MVAAATCPETEPRAALGALESAIWHLLESVPDPEIPVLSVVDLGIVRYVRLVESVTRSDALHVGITPTYSEWSVTPAKSSGVSILMS